MADGTLTVTSSSTPLIYQISRDWRALVEATPYHSDTLERWSEKEEKAARLILTAATYLHQIGCTDIEQLLRDVATSDSRQSRVG